MPGAVILLAPMLLLWRLIVLGQVIFWGVPMTQFYPWHTLVNRALAAGRLPLWTDLLGAGAPLLANHQTAIFYPPNLIFRLFPVEHALGYSVLLHLVGAGLAAWFWGRTLKLNRLGQTVLIISYALGGYVVGRTQFITMVAAYAWLPLLLALTERLVTGHRRRDLALLGLAQSLQLLAGHAQIWFYSLVLVWLYGVFRLAQTAARQRTLRPALTGLLLLGGALILALSVSAVQVIPTAELALQSQRSGGAEWEFAMTYSYWPWHLLTMAAPNLFGSPALGNYAGYANYWEDNAYVGILPLLFALLAAVSWLKNGIRPSSPPCGTDEPMPKVIAFWVIIVPLTFLLAMGKNTPVFPWVFQFVPGFGFFQAPARLLIWAALAISTLAGIGAHQFRLTYHRQYTLRLIAAGSGAMLLVALAAMQLSLPDIHIPAFARLAVTLALAAGILLLGNHETHPRDERVSRSPFSYPVWTGLVVACISIDLLIYGVPLTPTSDAQVYQTQAAGAEPLAENGGRLFMDPQFEYDTSFKTYFRFDTFGPAEIDFWRQLRRSKLPNLNAVDNLPSVNNNEPLVIERWKNLMEGFKSLSSDEQERLLRLLNVGFVSTDRPSPGMMAVPGEENLYQLPDPGRRAWLAPAAIVTANANESLAAVLAPGFDPQDIVVIEGEAPPKLAGLEVIPQWDPNPVDSLHEGWNQRTIRLTASSPAYLVLAYTYYPGWQATIDNQPARLWRANYTLMAVAVKAGSHEVVLTYRPWWLTAGPVVSCLSLLGGILLALPLPNTKGKKIV